MALLKMGFEKRDLAPFMYPKLRDLKKIGYKSLCYGTLLMGSINKQN